MGFGVGKLCEDGLPSPQGAPETCRKRHVILCKTAVLGLKIHRAPKASAVHASLSMFN